MLKKHFFAPVDHALDGAKNQRQCKRLPDADWMRMGVQRVLEDGRSGREFLQSWNIQHSDLTPIGVVQYFDAASSRRRLKLAREVNEIVAALMPEHEQSGFAAHPGFDKFEVYAGDGHYIGASAHEQPVQGKKRPCGHFYTLNLRTRAMTHLSVADLQDGLKKSEHDMHALKRLGGKALRQGAKTGRKVLYVWDPAGIDIDQWGGWKSQYGVYFISRTKANMSIIEEGENAWEREDTANTGVLSDTFVRTHSSSTRLREIVYQEPQTGEIYRFITTEMTLSPGLVAWVYKCRWDVEKTYDTFKNKLGQTQAWGKTEAAKGMQAQFVCLTHNLMVLLESALGIEDKKETARASQRIETARTHASQHGRRYAPQYQNPRKRTQIAAKFIRWLRGCLATDLHVAEAVQRLRLVYAIF